jgi:hypothetical protein
MRKTLLAGALALALVGSSSALAGEGFVVTESHISHFKAALNLTPEQEPYWRRIEVVLRDIARRQHADAATLDADTLQRLVATGMPLFRRLDAEQKRDAMRLARVLGISSLAAAF